MRSFLIILFIRWIQVIKSAEELDILLIVVDDAGYADVGWNNPLMRSPFLDKLANSKNTMKLDRFYAYPTCSPTRGALLTGRYAHENSLTFAIVGPRAVAGVDPKIPFFTNILKEKGYGKFFRYPHRPSLYYHRHYNIIIIIIIIIRNSPGRKIPLW